MEENFLTVPQWVFCAFWRILDVSGWAWLEDYRIHEPDEVKRLNRATVGQVVRTVFTEQVLQTIIGSWWLSGRTATEDALTLNHVKAMEGLVPIVRNALALVLGPRNAEDALTMYGRSLIWWTYWWVVPALQMFVAL